MTGFAESFMGEELHGFEICQMNEALYDNLEELTSRAEDSTRRENFWRRNGANIALTPMATAGLIMITPIGERLTIPEKIGTGYGTVMASFILGIAALNRHDHNRKKVQQLAKDAMPISHALNNRTLPWIEQRLRQKAEDGLRVERNSGINGEDT